MGWDAWFWAADYTIAREILQRGVAALFLVAFLSSLNQFPALLGERGLLPTEARPRHARGPTLFRWGYSDRRLRLLCAGGVLLAASVVAGLPQLGPPWLPALAFLALWSGYLSIVNIGGTFYAFGWEMLLLEAGFLVAFLGSNETAPPTTVLILVAWLVFRLEFGAGLIKIRGGREWRDLTALTYHHETQPMPGPFSRQAHLLPRWFHRLEAIANHVAQLGFPWLLFAPQPAGSLAAAVIVATQLWLVVTGNFAWLNAITIVLALGLVPDPTWAWLFAGGRMPLGWVFGTGDGPLWWLIVVLAASALLVASSWWPLKNLFSKRQLMNASFTRWQLVNAYGAFGTVTKQRIEIVVEGSAAGEPGEGDWLAYEFRGKPGEVGRIPRQFAPYHLRLDWLMWFLPLGRIGEPWFDAFLVKLLEADPAVLRLLRVDPFGGERPRWVRAVAYRYRFATRAEFRRERERWVRERRGEVVPPVSLGPG